VFQASEGGPVSVGRRKLHAEHAQMGATPTPAPQTNFEVTPTGTPQQASVRISRMGGSGSGRVGGGRTPVSSPLAVSAREIVLSKSGLAGICLITFACGIVTTELVDRARPRDREIVARDPEPAPPRAVTAPPSEPPASRPIQTAPSPPAPAPLSPPAPPQAAPAPAPPTEVAAAAADPVVVQMPNLGVMTKLRSPTGGRTAALAPTRQHTIAAPVPAAKSKPVIAAKASPVTPKAKPKDKPLIAASASPAPVTSKPRPVAAVTSSGVTPSTKPASAAEASTPAARAKPVATANPAGGTKKAKPPGPTVPPKEWVDPFTQ
jgi:hypothetical protein